jgi:O-antigen/teichoic acid export membrane protein
VNCTMASELPSAANSQMSEFNSGYWFPNDASLLAESSSLLAECARAAHAYGAFLLLSVADLLLATHVLTGRSAAVYAAGSVMTKAALWLPQSVANVLFASMTDHRQHRELFLRAVAWLTGLGVVLVGGCALVGGLVTKVVAGNQYPELNSDIWLFAALGSSLAIVQFTLVTGLAIRDGRSIVIVWTTIVAEVVYVLVLDPHGMVRSIVVGVLVINVVAAGAALLQRLGRAPVSATAPAL